MGALIASALLSACPTPAVAQPPQPAKPAVMVGADLAWPTDIIIDRTGRVSLPASARTLRERTHPDDLLRALERVVAEREERIRRLDRGQR